MFAPAQLHRVPDVETIRRATREILAQPEFASPWPWLEKIVSLLQAIKEWLDQLEAWAIANPQWARILTILAVVLLIGLLLHLLYLALGDLLPWRQASKEPAARATRLEILEGTAQSWREGADRALGLLQAGDLRRAVWIAHRVLLGLLDERGALKFAGSKTNSQYLRECPVAHPWYDIFADLTKVYEQSVYAQRTAQPAVVAPLIYRIESLAKNSTDDIR